MRSESGCIQTEARRLVEEVLRTGVFLVDIVGGLIDETPDDAFPGESLVEVLIEMVSGSVQPAVAAAGPDVTRQARALVGAVLDRVVEDLREAERIARKMATSEEA